MKRSLRQMIKEPPEELQPVFEMITHSDHPDMSVVILGCAALEHLLGEAIMRNLPVKVDRETLLSGPLSDLHRKIVMAEALGLILPATAIDLQRVRRIRNAFAHAPVPLSFATPEVVEQIDQITFFGKRAEVTSGEEEVSAKVYFAQFVFMACMSLYMKPEEWSQIRDEISEWVRMLAAALDDFHGVVRPPRPLA